MIDERVRGSSEIPLSKRGIEQARTLGKQTAGQVDKIHTSSLGRAIHTAAAIKASNPDAETNITKDLHPWRLGGMEGKPIEEMLPRMQHLVADHPDEHPAPGRGPLSTEDGESFNAFKDRFLGHLTKSMAEHEPGSKEVHVAHYRNIHATNSWLKKGAPADHSIDIDHFNDKGDTMPGDLFYINPRSKQLEKVDNAKRPGIYLARHGETDWNQNGQAS